MTIQQIVTRVNDLRPNQYTVQQVVKWIEQLDRVVWDEVISTHERPEGMPEAVPAYDEADMAASVLAPDQYADLYEYWVYAQMDMSNMEMDKYSNDYAMYNAAWARFENAWNRKHQHVGVKAINYGQLDRKKGFDPLGG